MMMMVIIVLFVVMVVNSSGDYNSDNVMMFVTTGCNYDLITLLIMSVT